MKLLWPEIDNYSLVRTIFLRALGFNYLVAFLCLVFQYRALNGYHGLLPVDLFLSGVKEYGEQVSWLFFKLPTLFWVGTSDYWALFLISVGLVISLSILLGRYNGILFFLLWVIYLSFVNTGQIFMGYGWEMLLLESGFLAVFFCPLYNFKGYSGDGPTPLAIVWLYRWLLFRLMLGAGLIKLRSSDDCWRQLTCLDFQFETQPNPNPLSIFFHRLPPMILKMGVLFNHLVELIVPFGIFGPQKVRMISGMLIIVFQALLIISGNLSWLNWTTLFLAFFCFDDKLIHWLKEKFNFTSTPQKQVEGYSKSLRIKTYLLVGVVALLSIRPLGNLISSEQLMNASFDSFHVVNTYGAFGTVGRERYEIILEGTHDSIITDSTHWVEYNFKCKPDDVNEAPCLITPYHYRLDWQMWFAAMQNLNENSWLIHLSAKLLAGNPHVVELLESNPFPEAPPRTIRAKRYQYQFAGPEDNAWWQREYLDMYFGNISLQNPSFVEYLKSRGWYGRLKG